MANSTKSLPNDGTSLRIPKRIWDVIDRLTIARKFNPVRRSFHWVSQAFWFIYHNVNDFMSVNGHYLAAAIAFYSFLSIFPLSIALITLWRLSIGLEGFEDRLITGILAQIPVLAETDGPSFVEGFIRNVSNQPAVTSSITGLGLFIAGMGVFGSIRKSVNVIWGIQRPRPFLIERAIDFIMMMVASSLLFMALLLSTFFSFISEITELLAADATPFDQWFLLVAGFVIPSLITYGVFTVIYWWLPNTKVRLVEILGVALLTTIAFEIAKYVFILFLRNSGELFTSIYGSISTVMMFFFFIYVEAIILLAGAMLSAKWSNHLRIRDQMRQNRMLIDNLRRIDASDRFAFMS